MEASELRIGNRVDFNGVIETLNIGHFSYADEMGGFECEPIPLTEQRLKDFEFKEITKHWLHEDIDAPSRQINVPKYFIKDTGDSEINICARDLPIKIIINDGLFTLDSSNCKVYIRSVHHLQNIWLDLTGEELTKR